MSYCPVLSIQMKLTFLVLSTLNVCYNFCCVYDWLSTFWWPSLVLLILPPSLSDAFLSQSLIKNSIPCPFACGKFLCTAPIKNKERISKIWILSVAKFKVHHQNWIVKHMNRIFHILGGFDICYTWRYVSAQACGTRVLT